MEHLDEVALEALATGRQDLVSEATREHLAACEACRERVEIEKDDAQEATVALRRAAPQVDLDTMIARAMQAVPVADGPSRRSLIVGAAIGGLVASGLALLALPGASVSGLSRIGRQGLTLGRAADSLVDSLVPGGWGSVAIVGLLFALLLAVPIRLLLSDRRGPGTGMLTGALGLLLAIGVSVPLHAHAYRVEGAWPDPQPTVTLDVDGQPTSEALRMATEAAGLGVVARLPNDPPVTLHVRNVPIGEVVSALIGDADVVVLPGPSLVTVRPDEAPAPAPSEPAPSEAEPSEAEPSEAEPSEPAAPAPSAAAAAPAPPAPPAPPSPPAGLGDRVTLGSDVVVGPDEVVRSVYTAGGDARVDGRAFGDVVTMGGDADIRGEVIGNVTTMGGDVKVRDGARVHGDLNAMGGHIDVADGATVFGQSLTAHEGHGNIEIRAGDDAETPETHEGETPEVVQWGLWHVLLFLLGLVMMGNSSKRFDAMRAEVAARPFRSLFGGIFEMLAGGVLCLVLVVTVIGIPVSAVLGTLLVAAVCVGWSAAAWWLGGVLPIRALKGRPVLQLAVGVGALFLAGLAPKVGPMVSVMAALAGLGATVSTRFGGKKPNERVHVPTGPFRKSR